MIGISRIHYGLFFRLFVSVVLALAVNANAFEFSATVTGVADGDTLTVTETLPDGGKASFKVRLNAIDAPEKGQPYGQAAKKYMAGMVMNRVVKIDCRKIDRYGRLVAAVTVDGRDVGLEMLKAGLAWHYKHFDQTPVYAQAEAKESKRGLWQEPNPTPPWDYRHSKKDPQTAGDGDTR